MSDTPNNGHCQQNLRRVVISSLIGAVIEWAFGFVIFLPAARALQMMHICII